MELLLTSIRKKAESKAKWQREELGEIIELIDLTTLEGTDNDITISDLCTFADSIQRDYLLSQSVYSICVYPSLIRNVKTHLKANSNVKIASVACAFPSGQLPLHLKLEEVKYAINEGADEIDMVISRGLFLAGKYAAVQEEIRTIKECCGDKVVLKVILETGELKSLENIRKASELALHAGADFIKTSTGKSKEGATMEAVFVMCKAIREFHQGTGKKAGIKVSGGVRSVTDAFVYLRLIESILGNEWIVPQYCRLGASSLAKNALLMLAK